MTYLFDCIIYVPVLHLMCEYKHFITEVITGGPQKNLFRTIKNLTQCLHFFFLIRTSNLDFILVIICRRRICLAEVRLVRRSILWWSIPRPSIMGLIFSGEFMLIPGPWPGLLRAFPGLSAWAWLAGWASGLTGWATGLAG